MKMQYTADGGGDVCIPSCLNPYDTLSIPVAASRQICKDAFRAKAKKRSRQERALASLSYAMITSKHPSRYERRGNEFTVRDGADTFFLAAVGSTESLMGKISVSRNLITAVNEHNHTLLYLAARSGFYDMTKALLSKKCPVNAQQVDGSTALHAASYFGQKEIVQLLLENGADSTIKNKWNNTAEDEAENEEVKGVFKAIKEDTIGKLEDILRKHNMVCKPIIPKYDSKGELVGKEICLDIWYSSLWETAWHGTKHAYLESICMNGLKPSGTTLSNGEEIETQAGHYKLGDTYFGIRDWARAIFVSPSILYAAHNCYAERISSMGKTWAIVVKACVNPSSYSTHDPTTMQKHDPIDGEPDAPEYRIPVTENDKILRISSTPDVIVRSVLFIRVDFLDSLDESMTYDDVKRIFE